MCGRLGIILDQGGRGSPGIRDIHKEGPEDAFLRSRGDEELLGGSGELVKNVVTPFPCYRRDKTHFGDMWLDS